MFCQLIKLKELIKHNINNMKCIFTNIYKHYRMKTYQIMRRCEITSMRKASVIRSELHKLRRDAEESREREDRVSAFTTLESNI